MIGKIFKTGSKITALGFYFLLFGIGITLDQVAKLFVHEPFRNYNFAFSVPLPTWTMFLIYIGVLAIVKIYLVKNFFKLSQIQKIAWTIIFAGAVSNVGERAVLGYVRDFIPMFGGILNFADLMILGGVSVLLWQELFMSRRTRA